MVVETRADFPRNASYKITVSRNLDGFSFPVACQITGHTDFLWKLFVKALMGPHIMQKIHGIVNLTFHLFGWRLLQCQHETLSSKSVVFFVWKPLKYYNALSLRTLLEDVLLTKTTMYIHINWSETPKDETKKLLIVKLY